MDARQYCFLRVLYDCARSSRHVLLTCCTLLALLAFLAPPASAVHFTIGQNFTGSNLGQSGFIPPDTMGAIGPNHFMELINGRYAVYNRTGALQVGSTLDTFWNNASNLSGVNGSFDPRVVYDHASARWFAAATDGANYLVGVSTSNDPTNTWNAFQIPGTAGRFVDFPMLGVDADGVYVTTNDFVGNVFTDVGILSLPKSDLLLAAPTVANRTFFSSENPSNRGFSVQPAVDFGPSDSRAALLAVDDNVFSQLNRTNVLNAAGPGAATLSASTNIAVPTTNFPPVARQPGPNDNIDAGDTRISGNVFEQGNSLWATVSVNVGGRAAVRWYEINETTNALLQSGTISDPILDLYYPSIAANANGDVVIGFSGSSDIQPISTYAAVGQTSAGTTTFDPIVLTQMGTGSYLVLDSNLNNRWGDYSATTLDPTDPFRFWTIQEYVSATNTWSTKITEIVINQVVIPEPSTLILVTLGLLALGLRRRRRRA